MGSGPVAASSLRLLSRKHDIVCVITKSSTEELMRQHAPNGTSIVTVSTKDELFNATEKHKGEACIGVLIDFGIIMSPEAINILPLGVINSHFSILPEWRGPDPISYALLSGQKVTGVSLMQLTAGLDEGPVYAITPVKILDEDTSITLTEKLVQVSANMIEEVLPDIINGEIKAVSQEKAAQSLGFSSSTSYSQKIQKQDGIIDWNKAATEIHRQIKAFIEWPKSRTNIALKDVVIISTLMAGPTLLRPGIFYIQDKNRLFVACGDNSSLEIILLKPAGKNEMSASAFIAGYGKLLTNSA